MITTPTVIAMAQPLVSSPEPVAERSASRSAASSASTSGVSWGAVLAGAAAAAALSLILLLLGSGLGLSAVSPWAQQGASATTLGVSAIVWLTVTQILASALGGYLAGRLRTKWVGVHTDEVYFRDTAHGFLSWAVSALATAALLTSAIGSIVGTGVQAGSAVLGGTGSALASAGAQAAGGAAAGSSSQASGGGAMDTLNYAVDGLFRRAAAPDAAAPAPADAGASPAEASAAVARIFLHSVQAGSMTPEDRSYAAQLIAQRAGISQQEAEQRVTQTFARAQQALTDAQTKAREAADTARKASSYAALWLFVSLLIGAFSASLAATYGGRQRDL